MKLYDDSNNSKDSKVKKDPNALKVAEDFKYYVSPNDLKVHNRLSKT